jgi:hypothetical protein
MITMLGGSRRERFGLSKSEARVMETFRIRLTKEDLQRLYTVGLRTKAKSREEAIHD